MFFFLLEIVGEGSNKFFLIVDYVINLIEVDKKELLIFFKGFLLGMVFKLILMIL